MLGNDKVSDGNAVMFETAGTCRHNVSRKLVAGNDGRFHVTRDILAVTYVDSYFSIKLSYYVNIVNCKRYMFVFCDSLK